MARKGKITDLMDFLHRVENYVQTGRGHHDIITKSHCQDMKDILQSSESHSGPNKVVSTIRFVLNYVENGKVEKLTQENINKALHECRQLSSSTYTDTENKPNSHQRTAAGPQHHAMPSKVHKQSYSPQHDARSTMTYREEQGQRRADNARTRDQNEHRTMTDSTYRRNRERTREEMEAEINELRMRLSSIAGSKLKDGNPSLVDLNDPNRPTRIAEQYRELYDNEWTNALEELIKSGEKEAQAILKLGKILKNTYDITKRLSEESTVRMTDVIKTDLENIGHTNDKQPSEPKKDISNSITAHVKAIRKENADMSIESVQNYCRQQLRMGYSSFVDKFAMKCARLTWLMNVQDPPLVLKWAKEGESFDSKYFNEFTTSGDIVVFTSWPALLIQENGAILAKGTAQPRKSK